MPGGLAQWLCARMSKVHPSGTNSASSRPARQADGRWPARFSLTPRRRSLPRFNGTPLSGTTGTVLDPLRRASVSSVPRHSLSSSASIQGAWYRDDEINSQSTGRW